MKTIFDNINVTYSEYSYFCKLDSNDKLQYLFELYADAIQPNESKSVDLAAFFDTVHKELQSSDHLDFENPIDPGDRVDVLIDDDNIMIESNSLKAIRNISLKFVEAGYLLARDKDMEKMFRKDKNTRYLRIYKIIDQVSTLCLN
jgi:hypothetical protein